MTTPCSYVDAKRDPGGAPRIEWIKIVWSPDSAPDLSDLTSKGRYDDIPDVERRRYEAQDRERLGAYDRDEWYFEGCSAKATVLTAIEGMPGSRRLHVFTSGGLWGIASDSDAAYKASVERDQLSDLKDVLATFGVDVSDFESKIA